MANLKKTPAKKPRKKLRKPGSGQPKKQQPANLPPPIEFPAAQSEAVQPEKPSLLSGLGNLFSPQPADPSSTASLPSLTSSPAEPLSQESERLLSAVPDVIGDNLGAGEPAAEPGDNADDPIAALMAQVAFEEQDIQDTLAEFFDWLSVRFKSDHWKLTDRQARMLGRPSAQLLNSMWARLQNYLPEILAKWCVETPGATAFILACGLVVTPKVMEQVRISRERAKLSRQTIQGRQPGAPKAPGAPAGWKPMVVGRKEAADVDL